jgi:hypothetical protein
MDILVVEDEPVTQQLFKRILIAQYCGHFLSEFSDDKSRNLIKKNTHVNLCFLNQTQEIKLTLI